MAFRFPLFLVRLPKLPLSLVLMVPFVLQLLVTVGLVGYFSYKTGQRSIQDLSHQLLNQAAQRIHDHLDIYLNIQQQAVAANRQAVQQGLIRAEPNEAMQRYLWQQMALSPALRSIFFVDEQGREVGYVRLSSQESLQQVKKLTGKKLNPDVTILSRTQPTNLGQRDYSVVDDQGQPQQLIYSFKIDNRTTPWYQSAKAAKSQSWSAVFGYRVVRQMGMAAQVPFYDGTGQFQGVFVSIFALSELSTFLNQLQISPKGQTFIMDRAGQVVATSTLETPFRKASGGELTRLAAVNSQDQLTKLVAERLRQQWPNLQQSPSSQYLDIQSPQGRFFVQISPYQDRYGLDWFLVGVVPEQDFAAHISANNRKTVLVCLVATIVSSGLSWLLARGIAKPLWRLSRGTQQLAQSNFQVPLTNSPIREVDELAQACQQMADQLQTSMAALTKRSDDLEGLFNAFFQLSSVGMAIVDNQFRFVQINDLLAQFNDRPVADHLGKTIWEVVPHLAPVIEPLFRQVLTTGTPILKREVEVEDATHPGQIRYRLVSYFPLLGENDRPSQVGVVVIDITDRKQAELALQQSEQQNRAVLEAIPDLILRFDRDGYRRGHVRSGSTMDLVPEEVDPTDCHISTFLPPEYAERQLQAIQTAINTGQIVAYEQVVTFSDGRVQYEEVRVIACSDDEALLLIRDITDRKLTEEKLRNSEIALAKAQQIAHLGSWELDPMTQAITWSEELYHIYGYDPSLPAPTYSQFLDHLSSEDAQRLKPLVDRAFREGIAYEIEYQFQRVNGDQGWILCRGEAERNEAGGVVKLRGACQDITDRKQAELALKEAKEAAEAANRAKSIFLANMSHELRTPLNAILGFTQLMGHDSSLTPQQKEHLAIVQRSGDHLLSLINDVLDMSKIEAGRITLETKTVDLLSLLKSLQSMFQQRAQDKGLQLIVEISPALPSFVAIDEGKLRQILVNLLGNAIKFTSQGTITLRAFYQSDPDQALPILTVEVEDTGVGVAEADLALIFKAFAQTQVGKQTAGGTGLGLAISRRLAELMAGELSVRSVLGQGSLFMLRLPVQVVAPPLKSAGSSQGEVLGLTPGQPAYRVLVVDDQADNRQLLIAMLSRIGLEVQSAQNGEEALQRWRSWQPHLIWMDLRMPDLDGCEVTERIRAEEMGRWEDGEWGDREMGGEKEDALSRFQPTKIVALTAQAFQDDRDRALAAGCDDFVTKPVQESILWSVMANHLGLSYVYAEPDSTIKTTAHLPPTSAFNQSIQAKLQPADLQVMPTAWITALNGAVAACYDHKIAALIDQIPEEYPGLIAQLRALNYGYDYETILKITEESLAIVDESSVNKFPVNESNSN